MIEEVSVLAKELAAVDPQTDPKITSFPSGALLLDVNVRGHKYVFEYVPSLKGFGVSRLDSATFGWEGVERQFDDFEGAKNYLMGLVNGSVPLG
jgi:hypothetical protein